jgi:hypothetical protein
MRQLASTLAVLLRAAARTLLALLGRLGNEPVRAYRPEAYYMRGPGPKWREKHFLDRASASRGFDAIAHRRQ